MTYTSNQHYLVWEGGQMTKTNRGAQQNLPTTCGLQHDRYFTFFLLIREHTICLRDSSNKKSSIP